MFLSFILSAQLAFLSCLQFYTYWNFFTVLFKRYEIDRTWLDKNTILNKAKLIKIVHTIFWIFSVNPVIWQTIGFANITYLLIGTKFVPKKSLAGEGFSVQLEHQCWTNKIRFYNKSSLSCKCLLTNSRHWAIKLRHIVLCNLPALS